MPNQLVDWPLYRFANGTTTKDYYDGSGPTTTIETARRGYFLKSWTNTPDFKARKRSGDLLPTNAFTVTEIQVDSPKGSFNWYPSDRPDLFHRVSGILAAEQYTDWTSYAHVIASPFYNIGDVWGSGVDRLANKLLNKIKDSSVNIAQMFGERKQTEGLIVNNLTRLAHAYDGLRSRNFTKFFDSLGLPNKGSESLAKRFKGSRDLNKTAANAWLEYTYGWKPLVQDIYGSIEALQKASKPRKTKVVVSDSVLDHFTSKMYVGLGNGMELEFHDHLVLRTKASCYFSIRNNLTKDMAASGITNPALLTWELLPYSFVVDWALPVGDYLSAFDAAYGVDFETGSYSQQYSVSRRSTASKGQTGSWTYEGYGFAFSKVKYLRRMPMIELPSPVFPSLKDPFSTSHVLSALSLLKQVFSRK